MGEKDVDGEVDITAFLSTVPYDQWVLVHPASSHPSPRYKHAAEVVEDKLYVIGGSRNGRYLSDMQVFDLRTLKWSTFSTNGDSKHTKTDNTVSGHIFPASAGHSLVKWENKLVVVAGHSKKPSDTVQVWLIDVETHSCSVPDTHGEVPIARGGQSVSIVGSQLIMFGGEDYRRKLLNDVHILDLKTMTWGLVETKKTAPAPRYDHTAAVYAGQYLLIFGGSSHSTCFNDLHLLDLQTMEWSQPETQGAFVTPRGGHAGTIIDDNWFIVGGGDNRSGATETVFLNMSKFVWLVTTRVTERDALASEGLTLCSTIIDGDHLLIAFGGYNGNYNNSIFIMKPRPRNLSQPRLLQSPAAAAAAASVTAAYAVITATDEKTIDVSTEDVSDIMGVQSESYLKEIATEVDALSKEKKVLESRLSEIRAENSTLMDRLLERSSSHNELTKELQSVQAQLAAESSRCSKLEAQIAAAQKRLESLGSLENELEILRHQLSQAEQNMAAAQRQRSAGVWQWMTGTPQNPDN